MGTLHEQPDRDRYTKVSVNEFFLEVQELSKRHKMSIPDVIAVLHVVELQRGNNLAAQDGNAWDEQISGIGHILENLVEAVAALRPKAE
jgi:hypothetical protein